MLLFLTLIGVFYFAYRYVQIANAYVAKTLCSAVFISGRNPQRVIWEQSKQYRQIDYLKVSIDSIEKSVRVSFLGLARRRAIFRSGLGATLVLDHSETELRQQLPEDLIHFQADISDKPWPEGNRSHNGLHSLAVDSILLTKILDDAFSEPDSQSFWRGTHAIVVVYHGQIVAERYAPGITANMPLLGWSMTKTVVNALTGILVAKGRLNLTAPVPVPEWQQSDDPRRHITLDQLLRMSSGLAFSEDYGGLLSDVNVMLFARGDAAAFAAQKPLLQPPDREWYYSSGTTNIIARILRTAMQSDLKDYFIFPYRELFYPIGMKSVVLEPDASGTFVGSSFMYATTRDWARFGLFLLQDGIWEGKRILPHGWLNYSTTPTPKAPMGRYGAHIWLNKGAAHDTTRRWLPSLPADLYAARGHDGQFLTIIPSRDVVVVRLGYTPSEKG